MNFFHSKNFVGGFYLLSNCYEDFPILCYEDFPMLCYEYFTTEIFFITKVL